jgi:hypothetical protein
VIKLFLVERRTNWFAEVLDSPSLEGEASNFDMGALVNDCADANGDSGKGEKTGEASMT